MPKGIADLDDSSQQGQTNFSLPLLTTITTLSRTPLNDQWFKHNILRDLIQCRKSKPPTIIINNNLNLLPNNRRNQPNKPKKNVTLGNDHIFLIGRLFGSHRPRKRSTTQVRKTFFFSFSKSFISIITHYRKPLHNNLSLFLDVSPKTKEFRWYFQRCIIVSRSLWYLLMAT